MSTRKTLTIVLSLALAASAGPTLADNGKKGPGKGHGNGSAKVKVVQGNPHGIPPGLAKKPGGMPPGQYKKIYGRGDRLPDGYRWIDDLDRWRLPPLAPGQGYVRYDDEIYRVARDTATVLDAIGIVSDWLR